MLADKIENDLKAAMKSKDILKVETLRMLKAALHNFLIEKRKEKAEDQEVMSLIQKQIKSREDSIEGFKKGGRQDLVDKEMKEKTILAAYLPAQLPDAELESIIKKAIQQTGAKSKADMGRVMKEAMAQSQGRADGKRINQIAASLLN